MGKKDPAAVYFANLNENMGCPFFNILSTINYVSGQFERKYV